MCDICDPDLLVAGIYIDRIDQQLEVGVHGTSVFRLFKSRGISKTPLSPSRGVGTVYPLPWESLYSPVAPHRDRIDSRKQAGNSMPSHGSYEAQLWPRNNGSSLAHMTCITHLMSRGAIHVRSSAQATKESIRCDMYDLNEGGPLRDTLLM